MSVEEEEFDVEAVAENEWLELLRRDDDEEIEADAERKEKLVKTFLFLWILALKGRNSRRQRLLFSSLLLEYAGTLRERFSPVLHVGCLQKGGAETFFLQADSSSMERVTRFDTISFSKLLWPFSDLWTRVPLERQGTHSRLRRRCLSSRTVLGLCLFFLAYSPPLVNICLWAGVSPSTVSKYLQAGLPKLLQVLRDLPEGYVGRPDDRYLLNVGSVAGTLYGEGLKGCCIVTDGSLHALEVDDLAQNNFWFDQWHIDYNGYDNRLIFTSLLYLFCL